MPLFLFTHPCPACSTWVIPVSITLSLLGCWASLYHMAMKWSAADHNGSWGCNLLGPL